MRINVAHIADLHVRGSSRHDEVRIVVEAFCESVKARATSDVKQHVVIAGDLWHTKASGITAEYIDLMTWMLRSMAEVADVHIVLGNHDGVLQNLSKQDAVSPIVDAIAHPRVKLYKQSGTYEIETGVNLCVYSVFDPTTWDDVLAVEGAYNIAVYHGPVAGSVSETGWLMEAPVTAKWFEDKGFDIVMLGDIHKKQFLGYKKQ